MHLPEGWHCVTPRIVTEDVPGLVGFLKAVFDATGEVVDDRPIVVRIGDSNLMVSAIGPRPISTAFLYVYVDDADAACERAKMAGATVLESGVDTPYGDRRSMVQDPWGNVWLIATYRGRT
jgi:uncharacterized glyoxalase superfamily protein PhnB